MDQNFVFKWYKMNQCALINLEYVLYIWINTSNLYICVTWTVQKHSSDTSLTRTNSFYPLDCDTHSEILHLHSFLHTICIYASVYSSNSVSGSIPKLWCSSFKFLQVQDGSSRGQPTSSPKAWGSLLANRFHTIVPVTQKNMQGAKSAFCISQE